MDLTVLKKGLVLCLIAVCSIGLILAQDSLVVRPTESIAVQGENVTLTCHFERHNTSSSGDDRFWWLRPEHNFRFVRNEAVLLGSLQRERYSVQLNREAGTYSLIIRNVQLLDGGKFTCSHRRDRYGAAISSEVATLTVLAPPPGGYPLCPFFPKSNLILSPTKRVALTCPPLSFMNSRYDEERDQRNGNIYFNWGVLEGFILQNRTTLLSYSPGKVPQGGTFCMTDHQILGHFPDRCSLVQEADVTTVLIQPAGVHVRVGENMTFDCKVHGAIQGIQYEWGIPSNLPSERIQIIKEGSKVTLINIHETAKRLNPQSISCKVTLENGVLKQAVANVTVIDHHHENHRVRNDDDIRNIMTSPTENSDLGHPVNSQEEDQPSQKFSKLSFRDFVTNPEKMAIVIGPSLAVIVFFLCFYIMLKSAVNKKVTVMTPPRIITTPPSDSFNKKANTGRETPVHIPAFSRSYSDATSYRFSRNFDIHNSFQEDGCSSDALDRNVGNIPTVRRNSKRRDEQRMNASMPSLIYKSNTLPSKGKRHLDLPPPPNSFMDLPQEAARSDSYIEPHSVEWRPKRSVHFATMPSKQMKKVKK